MTHSFYQVDFGKRDIPNLGSYVRNVNPQYIGSAYYPCQNSPDNTLCHDMSWWIFINIVCFSFQSMDNSFSRVVIGDVLCMKRNPGGCKCMFIEVLDVILRTRGSKLRKWELKLAGKPTTEGQRHPSWIHPVKTKNEGKWKDVEAEDRSSSAGNGLGPARNQTDSGPIRSRFHHVFQWFFLSATLQAASMNPVQSRISQPSLECSSASALRHQVGTWEWHLNFWILKMTDQASLDTHQTVS